MTLQMTKSIAEVKEGEECEGMECGDLFLWLSLLFPSVTCTVLVLYVLCVSGV